MLSCRISSVRTGGFETRPYGPVDGGGSAWAVLVLAPRDTTDTPGDVAPREAEGGGEAGTG
jgi:hypothetical protein